jgi:hypothetical protein
LKSKKNWQTPDYNNKKTTTNFKNKLKMKHFMRQNLDELAQWAPAIDEATLRTYIGGGASNDSYYYDVTTADPYGYVTDDPYGGYVTTADPYYGCVTVDPYAYYATTADPYNSIYGITTPSGDITTPIPEINTTMDPCIFEGVGGAANAAIAYLQSFHGPTASIDPGSIGKIDNHYEQKFRVEYDTPVRHEILEYRYQYTRTGNNDNWTAYAIVIPSNVQGFERNVPCETNNETTTCAPYNNGGGTPYPYSSGGGTPYPN